MKATGIVRKVDELGRLVLPIELRKVLGIEIKDSIEIFTEDDTIILRKYRPSCGYSEQIKKIRDNISEDSAMRKSKVIARIISGIDEVTEILEGEK